MRQVNLGSTAAHCEVAEVWMYGAARPASEVLRQLVRAAGLPAVVPVQPINTIGDGLDTRLTQAGLEDGRLIVLRQSDSATASTRTRVEFLRADGIATPELYASDDAGSSLWEYITGHTLAHVIADGHTCSTLWSI